MELLERSQIMYEVGNVTQAQALLTELIRDQPDFAEAWNRRALLYYNLEHYKKSRDDCQQVIKLIPFHFGALHG
jgi:tetratricopeptide (TPR) repeat protein